MIEQMENNEIVQVERLSFLRCLYLQTEQIKHLIKTSTQDFFEHFGLSPVNTILIERCCFYESHIGEHEMIVCRGKVIDRSEKKQRCLFD